MKFHDSERGRTMRFLGKRFLALTSMGVMLGLATAARTERTGSHSRPGAGLPHRALRRGLLQRVHARRPGCPPGQGRGPDEGRRPQRGPHGRIHMEPMGARGRPLRVRLDGPCSRRDGQGRHQGHPGHAYLLGPRLDSAPAPGDSGPTASPAACSAAQR